MDRFIRRENVKHYRELLQHTSDAAEREQILKLLAEEEAKEQASQKRHASGGRP